MTDFKFVPHFFYDLLARILPGVLFLTELALAGVDTGASRLLVNPEGDSASVLIAGVGLLVLAYFVGYVLGHIGATGLQSKLEAAHGCTLTDGRTFTVLEQYYTFRQINEAGGFRVLKLRAEARMLDVARNASILALVLTVTLLLQSEEVTRQSAMAVAMLVVAAVVFQWLRKPAWKRYCASVNIHFKLFCKEEVA